MLQRTLQRFKARQLPDGVPISFNTPRLGRNVAPKLGAAVSIPTLNDERPSKKVLDFAAKLDIGFPTAMRLLPRQHLAGLPFRISMSPRHTFSNYHTKFFGIYEHPFTEKLLHHYKQQKEARGLWCYVQAATGGHNSPAVVRTASERAAKAALFRALNAVGYDASGKSLDESKSPLRGTIRLVISEPKQALQLEFQQVTAQLVSVLSKAAPVHLGAPQPLYPRQPDLAANHHRP